MNHQQLVQDRIRKIVAIAIVIFLLFGLRLIEIQAIRAKGYVERADNELSKSATLLAPRGAIYVMSCLTKCLILSGQPMVLLLSHLTR